MLRSSCLRLIAIACSLAALVLAALVVPRVAAAAPGNRALGTRLVTRYLFDLQRHDVADLRRFLSPAFQVARGDGLRQTKSEILRNPPEIHRYTIRAMQVTTNANVLIATFELSVREVIGGKPFHTKYAPRAAGFIALAKGWQMINYANFNTPR